MDNSEPKIVNVYALSSHMVSNGQKWIAAILLGILFALISSNLLYRLTNSLFTAIGFPALYKEGGPTLLGLLIHTVVFILIVRLLMW